MHYITYAKKEKLFLTFIPIGTSAYFNSATLIWRALSCYNWIYIEQKETPWQDAASKEQSAGAGGAA